MTDKPHSKDLSGHWDRLSSDWEIQVGEHGDNNRRLNSDPVLWKLAGKVQRLTVLDAGCGTGYLSRKLHQKGAVVTGVDFSEKMIEIARRRNPGIKFLVDSCSELKTLDDASFDMVISNYVLMDLEDLHGAMHVFARVLKPGGTAVLVFSHPCFPAGRSFLSDDDDVVNYRWDFSYFSETRRVDPPWGHFKSEFIWFHRPLSEYWKAFKEAGFEVTDLEEPRVAMERYHLAANERQLKNAKNRPYSVAFKLRKPGGENSSI